MPAVYIYLFKIVFSMDHGFISIFLQINTVNQKICLFNIMLFMSLFSIYNLK